MLLRAALTAAPRVLVTPRLHLESSEPRHAAAFAQGLAQTLPALTFISWGQRPFDLNWAQSFCENDARCVAAGEDLVFHAFTREDRVWVGRIDVHSIDFDTPRGEIGYVGNLRSAGQGLMREAVLAVIDLCFSLGFARIEALSDARNRRALHFAETLGLQREGLLRCHDRDPQGDVCDEVLYAIVKQAVSTRGAMAQHIPAGSEL